MAKIIMTIKVHKAFQAQLTALPIWVSTNNSKQILIKRWLRQISYLLNYRW